MRKIRLFSIAALALVMAACSSEENTLETQSPAAPGKLHFTATIATPDNGAGTRTEYSEQTDGTINVAWKENDKIAAIVINSEKKYVKTELTVSKVNTDGSAVISGDIAKPKDDALTVDLIYPADIVTVAANGSKYTISFDKMRSGTLDGTLESIANNIDYRTADGCELTVSGDKATLTSAAKLESKLSIWKLTLQDKDGNPLSASKVAIVSSGGVAVASATLATAGSTAYLPVPAATGDICISATTADNDYFYMKEGVALEAKKYYQSTVQMTKGAHLAFLSADYEAKDGETLTGTLASNVKISIADGATVTLKDANINGSGTWTNADHAGITCAGTATINLEGEGTNTVKGFKNTYPGIYVPENKTLTINGPGSLKASTGGTHGSGIGGIHWGNCGNITINGGTITAEGGAAAAAIGSGMASSCGDITITGGNVTAIGNINNTDNWKAVGIGCGDGGSDGETFYRAKCGNINISGGTVTARGKNGGVGIGSGWSGDCGTITITSGVTSVTATKGEGATNSIGAGDGGTCGTITIGGVVGAITTSPYEYPLPALSLTNPAVGEIIGSDGKNYAANATLPTGVTKVAMIAYVSGSNGLALALADEGSMNWETAESTAAAHTPIFTGGTWRQPTQDEWNNMFSANGGSNSSYTGLNNALATAGGDSSKLQAGNYWSSTPLGAGQVYYVELDGGNAREGLEDASYEYRVRACLAF